MHDLLISAINLKEAPPLLALTLSGCKREDGRRKKGEEEEGGREKKRERKGSASTRLSTQGTQVRILSLQGKNHAHLEHIINRIQPFGNVTGKGSFRRTGRIGFRPSPTA